MSSLPISSQNESFSQTANNFSTLIFLQTSGLMGRQFSIAEVEDMHSRLIGVYNWAMGQSRHIAQTYSENSEEIDALCATFESEEKVETALRYYNNMVLTFYPTAKIEYGRPCIGPLKTETLSREIRGDGNCFASALTVRFIETLIEEKGIYRFVRFLLTDGINAPECKREMSKTLLQLEGHPSQTETLFADNQKILPFVRYFRALAADEMRKKSQQFEEFFINEVAQVYQGETVGKSYDELIDSYVCMMGIDFCHPSITALCQRLQFNVTIIDPKIGNEFPVLGNDTPSKATFCRQDAHYYVLYPKPVERAVSSPQTTRIEVRYDAGFGNTLYIRGEGCAELNWKKGVPLKNKGKDLWIFETQSDLTQCQYKLLLNDKKWETVNDNRKMEHGKNAQIKPKFPC